MSTPTAVFAPAAQWRLDNVLKTVTGSSASDLWALGDENTSSMLVARKRGSDWSIASPNVGGDRDAEMSASVAFGSNDVWAAGSDDAVNGNPEVRRWNGASWMRVPYLTAQQSGLRSTRLLGVGGTSANDVWVTGFGQPRTGTQRPVIAHWNGSAFAPMAEPSGAVGGWLADVSAVSPTKAYAVGGSPGGPLVERWNGSSWTALADMTGTPTAALSGVSAQSGSDVWMVGSAGSGTTTTLIQHWNGTALSVIPSPSPGGSAALTSIAGSGNDLWAVGSSRTGSTTRPLILHWSGGTWQTVTVPSLPGDGRLLDISVLPDGSTWAVGTTTDPFLGIRRTLVMRLTASGWAVQSTPSDDRVVRTALEGVDASASDDVWAAGYIYPGFQPVVERNLGNGWQLVPLPNVRGTWLHDISVLSPTDVWAVGQRDTRRTSTPVAYHWTGGAWSQEPLSSRHGVLDAVDAVSADDVWATGRLPSSNGTAALEHWNGSSWSRVEVAVPTDVDFADVVARSATDVRAVGGYFDANAEASSVLAKWNGIRWNVQTLPKPGHGDDYAAAVTAVPSGGLWAAGSGDPNASGGVVQHFVSGRWTLTPTPPLSDIGLSGDSAWLQGIAGASSSDVWTVGVIYSDGSQSSGVVERWDGGAWSYVTAPAIAGSVSLDDVVALPNGEVWIVGTGGKNRILHACS
jgi:hypothetical protein